MFKRLLKKNGFTIHEFGQNELKYAFYAEYGNGHPVVAMLGEYDALPGLSQEGGYSEMKPVENGGAGHGCGHNLIGACAFGGALSAKKYLEESGHSGTVRFYGCPQEEMLDGKVLMAKYHAFDGGEAPNIVPKEAASWYYVRAPHRKDVVDITRRVINCQKGGALMTDTVLDYEIAGGCYELLPNDVLCALARKNFEEMEMCPYTEEENALARALS